jgi:hypothetical protein
MVVIEPFANVEPDAGPDPVKVALQLSDATGVFQLAVDVQALRVIFDGIPTIVGNSVSFTVTVCVSVLMLP